MACSSGILSIGFFMVFCLAVNDQDPDSAALPQRNAKTGCLFVGDGIRNLNEIINHHNSSWLVVEPYHCG